MAIIKADNPRIEKELHLLEDLVSESGGGIHSNLVIREQGGDLSVETNGLMGQGKEIIRLARKTLLPDDQYDMVLKGDEFSVTFPTKSNLSIVQRKLIETVCTLYTITGKAALHKDYSFPLSIAPYAGLLDKISEGRAINDAQKNTQKELEKGLTGQALDDYICSSFLKTRHLGYNDHVRASSVRVIMPVVDFLNHSWTGGSFNVGQGTRQGDLVVNNSQPYTPESLECYAFYGVMDSFDALIRYDFVDERAPIIRSVSVDLETPYEGMMKILDMPGALNKKKLAKNISDLSRFMPVMNMNKKTRTMTLSNILIPVLGSPLALRRILSFSLIHLIKDLEEEDLEDKAVECWVKQAEEKILKKNEAFYNDLLLYVENLITDKGESAGLTRLKDVIILQLKKLEEYRAQHAP